MFCADATGPVKAATPVVIVVPASVPSVPLVTAAKAVQWSFSRVVARPPGHPQVRAVG